ncbi:hypothetical protein HAX54_020297 [Datura stramonium]|uniref:Uncharacterized protein n=1 Tax=Datura stramonium TaxID=4076 RepID=A0ABS8S2T5_DATST|nr:hypothetical protein [Datura stramonium]
MKGMKANSTSSIVKGSGKSKVPQDLGAATIPLGDTTTPESIGSKPMEIGSQEGGVSRREEGNGSGEGVLVSSRVCLDARVLLKMLNGRLQLWNKGEKGSNEEACCGEGVAEERHLVP